ncbi:rhomboid family intramembrane serine protease [Rhodopseudomonas sp. P2A-2r]|uniref:rhomboid family intramembrane serine protease n=1 Tax=unclassified Rhodopseudomonas TaxID=2638247 RepID=UPI0022349657|nr:rhomboid family intramembrane serine protease [Rhodopseudomonas sp. P2A-2r]UZE47471.1 rhomboid family intramembrane serine protease [Rhodopseudomonas sp. P2A-2r]
MQFALRRIPVSWIWAASIVLVWICVSIRLQQPLWAQQTSQALVAFGTLKGGDFAASEACRLVASQWLHVKFLHMLFNALVIAGVGQFAEVRFGRWTAVSLGLAGGTLAQLVTVYALPDAYISGASQAYLALCGLVLATGAVRSVWWWIAVVAVAIGAGLDLLVSGHATIKPGHLAGFAFGAIAGLALQLAWRTSWFAGAGAKRSA